VWIVSIMVMRGRVREVLTWCTELFANDSVALDHLTAEGVTGDDDMLEIRVESSVVVVFNDRIDGRVGGYGVLVVGVLVVGTGGPLAGLPHESTGCLKGVEHEYMSQRNN
jgi:hypothetical protein